MYSRLKGLQVANLHIFDPLSVTTRGSESTFVSGSKLNQATVWNVHRFAKHPNSGNLSKVSLSWFQF